VSCLLRSLFPGVSYQLCGYHPTSNRAYQKTERHWQYSLALKRLRKNNGIKDKSNDKPNNYSDANFHDLETFIYGYVFDLCN
tara:strand:+ start:201 stop:446 length:246 start_codon:yes stop_codon:yes gene_type:complete